MNPRLSVIPIFLAICLFFSAAGSAAELSPEEIIARVDEVRSPRGDYTISVGVTSYSSRRQPKSAVYEVLVKGSENTVIKTIKPENEYGRVLLMKERNLWAFFPEVSKPLRLSMQERLFGDVSNGDIARVNFSGDYEPSILRTETIGKKEYYVLSLTARSKDVTYGKVLLWAQKITYWPLKAQFYALSGKLLKECTYEEYAMLGNRLRPTQLVMTDPVFKGKKSVVTYGNLKEAELPEKYFTKEYMKKMME